MSAIVYQLYNQRRPRGGFVRRLPVGEALAISPRAVLTVYHDRDAQDMSLPPRWTIATREWTERGRFEASIAINAQGLGWHIHPLADEWRSGRLVAVHLYFLPAGAAARSGGQDGAA